MEQLVLNKSMKVKNVGKIWKTFLSNSEPLEIDFNKVENFDGAGLQLLIYILTMIKETPEMYSKKNLKKGLINKVKEYGYII